MSRHKTVMFLHYSFTQCRRRVHSEHLLRGNKHEESDVSCGGQRAVWSCRAKADVPEAEWEQFKAQFAAMSQRMNALEAENQQLRAASKSTIKVEDLDATNAEVASLKKQNQGSSWAESIKWKGDFRYRYEDIEEDGKDDRDRNRIRARAGSGRKAH